MAYLDFKTGLNNIQLDIVGFLAILGEASVLANAQIAALSKWSYLPRLLPAPQALIRTERPERLEASTGRVIGSHSGNIREKLNHVAHILHSESDKLEKYSVRVVNLTENKNAPAIKASWKSPVTMLSALGTGLSMGLLIYSVVNRDGMSLIATLLLSLLSTFIGIGSKWELELPSRDVDRDVPPSDVIIAYPHGAFLIVQCDENIARRLYWAPEKCNYIVEETSYRFISLVGTLFLMGGVITLANATNDLQLAWAIAYIVLNAAYWIVAALPPRWNWDLSSFTVKEVVCVRPQTPTPNLTDPPLPPKMQAAEEFPDPYGERNNSFTEALWQAIAVTGSSQWARAANVAPANDGWDEWLRQAVIAAGKRRKPEEKGGMTVHVPQWRPREVLTEVLGGNGPAENKA